MRRKLNPKEKRNSQIGIKVKQITKEQIEYIANLEGKQTSTYINEILTEHIKTYFKIAKIDWEKLTPEEKGRG